MALRGRVVLRTVWCSGAVPPLGGDERRFPVRAAAMTGTPSRAGGQGPHTARDGPESRHHPAAKRCVGRLR
ncbi:hypothetical protein GCM10010249_59020 [Streptomyces roseolilacinus]|uniref:Uncharacterized protein n=1 Tax=Streptomyces roseolilacinus TaxID=66904 RepID=A0A918EMS0_9ACTN|nr:hypothetical protein GCM10010249_59020 [Streptomyces roseolilacinus]